MPNFLASASLLVFLFCLHLSADGQTDGGPERFTSTIPSSLRACDQLLLTWEGGSPPFGIGLYVHGPPEAGDNVVILDIGGYEHTVRVPAELVGQTIRYTVGSQRGDDLSIDIVSNTIQIEPGECDTTPSPDPTLPSAPPPPATVTERTSDIPHTGHETALSTESKDVNPLSSPPPRTSSHTSTGIDTSATSDHASPSSSPQESGSVDLLPSDDSGATPSSPNESPVSSGVDELGAETTSQSQTSTDVRLIVGVTVPLGGIAIALVVLGVLCCRRSRRQKHPAKDRQLDNEQLVNVSRTGIRRSTVAEVAGESVGLTLSSLGLFPSPRSNITVPRKLIQHTGPSSDSSDTPALSQAHFLGDHPTNFDSDLDHSLAGDLEEGSTHATPGLGGRWSRPRSTVSTLSNSIPSTPRHLFLEPNFSSQKVYDDRSTNDSSQSPSEEAPAQRELTGSVFTIVEGRHEEQRRVANEVDELRREIALLRRLGRYDHEMRSPREPYTSTTSLASSSPPPYHQIS